MNNGIHQRPKIVAPNGLPYASSTPEDTIDEMNTGIEQVIDMQVSNGGKGVAMTPVQLQTIIIYELARTKQFAMAEVSRLTAEKNAMSQVLLKLLSTIDVLKDHTGIKEEDIERRIEDYRAAQSDQLENSQGAGGREQGTDDAQG